MNLSALKYFVAVAEQGSFANAAVACDIDPSTMSRHIAALERELGARLFQRSTRQVALTEIGTHALAHARQVLSEVEALRDATMRGTTELVGRVRLSASVAYGERRIAPLLGRFQARYPRLTLEMILSDANQDLVAEAIDLVVRHGPGVTGDLVVSRLHSTRYRVCATPDFLDRNGRPEHLEALVSLPCLGYALPGLENQWYCRHEAGYSPVPISTSLSLSSPLALRGACLGGAGLALLADWLVEADLATGALVSLLDQDDLSPGPAENAAWLVYASRPYLPRRVRALIDFLREELQPA
ncbi:LysR family transcriptional regulator [uncultured Devosia sp.]|uniref:LysR family transcriptional regulator n=1 Tax=uncultured Devosia sp. TaxID=211434 RepID=UPI00262CA899|nr:LysR family transcriptional regulator [uncultured Devosia sp.]